MAEIKRAYEESADASKRVASGVGEDEYRKLTPVERAKRLQDAYERFSKAGKMWEAFESAGRLWLLAKAEPEQVSKAMAYKYVLAYRACAQRYMKEHGESVEEVMGYLGRSYRLTARDVFDDFCIYTEWNRPMEKKFYLPRRKALLPIVHELQKLADDKLDILCISAPPGIGKSATALFFINWMAGRNPDDAILVSSHSRSILEGMYNECVMEMDSKGEYLFADVFPENQIARTNADNLKIDLKTAKRFSTIQFGAVEERLAGKVRAMQLLYCDDLIEGIDEALSAVRLEAKWQRYSVNLRQRKQGKCKELHIATRWSVHDVIGRLETMYENYPKAKFIRMPALNEKGESNFAYGGDIGFTTEFFEKQREVMDEMTFNALYQQEPVERGGLLYEKKELNYFYELPEGDPDGIISVCDTATGGGDYTAMPVGYIYGDKHYIADVVFTDALPEVSDRLCASVLYNNKVQRAQFESNGAGGRTADSVEGMVAAKVSQAGGRKTNITKKYTTANKETKILMSAAWVKEHCLFRDPSTVKKNTPYSAFMKNLLSYTVKKPPKHDDAADAMAQYSLFADAMTGSRVQVIKRIW